ncbi:PLP-dependent transferase [Aaosphaeria arxii CBS 175.79]|uniref:PLP-dependent transferase n=1 Tax=Aaosphaeria arxii CBS 175.79 TaxID=1450172 RepID=A0A6A5Y7V4_9PLEO|nr:PLP-dependent transferase [Aaosphaeria arxii CBS 175.79]KAF2021652.1 PLP-dependent transferase [Aaosphaeria arxii CBS 175.79]
MAHPFVTESNILHRDMRCEHLKVVSGEGIRYHLGSGKSISDATCGPSVSILGHGNQEVTDAIIAQLGTIQYVYSGAPLTSEPSEALAKFLLEDRPGGLSKGIFVNSGSEATDAALKLVTQYWHEIGEPNRKFIISRKQSYHGNSIGSLSFVDPCYSFRAKKNGESDAAYVERLRQQLEDTFQRLGPNNVAAFMAEPQSGTTLGCVTATPGYFKMVRDICDKYGALLVLDEIICGMGKTGTMHAWEQEGIRGPDVQTIGKVLGAGFVPLSGVLVHERVFQALVGGSKALLHGHTFQAHPLACAAALAVQKIVRRDNLLENVCEQGLILEKQLRERIAPLPYVADIRGRGLFWGVELMRDPQSKEPFDRSDNFCGKVVDVAMDLGLNLLGSLGHSGELQVDHVIVAPPYIVEEADVVEIVGLLHEAISRVGAEYSRAQRERRKSLL